MGKEQEKSNMGFCKLTALASSSQCCFLFTPAHFAHQNKTNREHLFMKYNKITCVKYVTQMIQG